MKRLLLFIFILSNFLVIGQIQIKGSIVDGITNETLIGANVILKESRKGTATNFNGKFVLIHDGELPTVLSISYLGYKNKEIEINSTNTGKIKLFADNKNLKEVKVIDNRITQKQKEAALTVESLDMIAIKETPSANFYDGLGALKGVDITAASLGFKVINTRGFNSTSPVRSLQIIDGVDNQSPGLNFSLGNFLGASELDIMKVEIIQGASSSYYGPNAFNGVISMTTLSPFVQQGLTVQYKLGSRNLFENSFRLAEKFTSKNGENLFAYKINVSYMQANDWEADNMDAVNGTTIAQNPGGYDAINRYGDEDTDGNLNDVTENFNLNYFTHPGLKKFHRTGYLESDIVDYATKNFKGQSSLHYMITPKTELIYALNYSTGTTVYQGDNRFSLKNIEFWQNKIELRQKDKFFIRAYRTQEDAGDSYDAVSTALRLQEFNQISNQDWYTEYKNNWRDQFKWEDIGWSTPELVFNPVTFQSEWFFNGSPIDINNWITMSDSVLNANTSLIIANHNIVRELTDSQTGRLIPGTEAFKEAFNEITSKTATEGGTGFYDKSALNHIHAEYFLINDNLNKLKIGGNFREYQPDTKGSLFSDTAITGSSQTAITSESFSGSSFNPIVGSLIGGSTVVKSYNKIKNIEMGAYVGFERKSKRGSFSTTLRCDKNENFELNFSPAVSLVLTPNEKDVIRFSLSSAIRNPTLADQYLYYNVGRAILIGNLNGHGTDYEENLVTIESLVNYYLPATLSKDSLKFFSVDPIQPEKARSAEIGYRTTLFNKIYLDANYYYTKYTDFIGYKIGAKFNTTVDDSITGAYEIALPSIQAYRMAANAENTVTTQGASIGINYYLHPNYSLNGNYSWNKLNEKGTEDPIIPAYNTPEHKYNLGIIGRDIHLSEQNNIFRNFGFSINYKWVAEFKYEGSPQFTGVVPSYNLVDVQLSKRFTQIDATLKLGSSNVLNNKHYQVYGGPYIGRMTYFSILFDIK